MLSQNNVDPRLPSGAGGTKALDHIGVEAQRYQLFWRLQRRSPASAPDQFFAAPNFGSVEKVVCQFRAILVFLPQNPVGVHLSQVRVNSPPALGPWPCSFK